MGVNRLHVGILTEKYFRVKTLTAKKFFHMWETAVSTILDTNGGQTKEFTTAVRISVSVKKTQRPCS